MSNKSYSQMLEDYVADITGTNITTTLPISCASTSTQCPACGSQNGCGCSTMNTSPLQTTNTKWSGTSISVGVGLTQEEKIELKTLQDQHAIESKGLKLQEFKQLHPEVRQTIVSLLFFQECSEKMDKISADKPARLQELEYKNYSMYFNLHANINLNINTLLPKDLTGSDLIRAHSEACIEEELSKKCQIRNNIKSSEDI